MKKQLTLNYWLSKTIVFVLCVHSFCDLIAQEVLIAPASNPIVGAKWAEEQGARKGPMLLDTLELPFFDDFAKPIIFPDPQLWLDKMVYINRNYPINPISVGVATFDGVSKTGLPYDTGLVNSGAPLPADTLTSKPIDLNFPNDSVYLSFYYQPRGNADLPDEGDSLVLEFKTPAKAWNRVWSHDGYNSSKVNYEDTSFHIVMIKVDAVYLKKGFQFRFRNRATPGNDDQWHIDYVKLDKRLINDTIFRDVAFVYNPTSLLKDYEAMPWNHYAVSEMRTELTNYIRNNDTERKNTFYQYEVKDRNGNQVIAGGAGSANIEPYAKYGYSHCELPTPCAVMLHPAVSNPLPAMNDSVVYLITHLIKPAGGISGFNDTLTRKQIFKNYFAYDDGSAELAYGLNVAGAKLAYQFSLPVTDTLRAVDMYFHWMPNADKNNISQRQFRITIWGDDNGKPGNIIFQDSITTPHYQYVHHTNGGNLTNAFYRYKLSSAINVSGTIYVGWVQYSIDLLNIGYDKSSNKNSKMFYNTEGNWNNSQLGGTWMIRPVFGRPEELVNVKELNSLTSAVKIYPNPANNTVYIDVESGWRATEIKFAVYDAYGRLVLAESKLPKNEALDISHLSNGFYFIRITDNKNNSCIKKLVVSK